MVAARPRMFVRVPVPTLEMIVNIPFATESHRMMRQFAQEKELVLHQIHAIVIPDLEETRYFIFFFCQHHSNFVFLIFLAKKILFLV